LVVESLRRLRYRGELWRDEVAPAALKAGYLRDSDVVRFPLLHTGDEGSDDMFKAVESLGQRFNCCGVRGVS
jgi:hypothetical protein